VLLPYLHYDVFTRDALAGNQLAVFLDGRGLVTATMQAIAREMNFSESVFVLPAEQDGTERRLRIFTPGVEMPMAGHPTIGSAFAMAHAGVVQPSRPTFVFGLNVGPVPIDLEWAGTQLRFAWMTQARPTFGRIVDGAAVTGAIGLDLRDLLSNRPLQIVSCGVEYLLVPLRDAASVHRAATDPGALRRLAAATGSNVPLYLFAPSPSGATTLECRMFAPGLGVLEDPATGSAAGPLGCYVVKHGLVNGADAQRIVISQGVAMGRPSRIHVAITGTAAAITTVKVGGEAVLVGEGSLRL
jgi:trans-2,3-dihydro-3-hydroxyanthranilate isomerase